MSDYSNALCRRRCDGKNVISGMWCRSVTLEAGISLILAVKGQVIIPDMVSGF